MSLTRDLQNVLPRTRSPPKHNFIFEKKPWKRDAPDKNPWKRDVPDKKPLQRDSSKNNNKQGLNMD